MAMDGTQIDLYKFLFESELLEYYKAIKNELKITTPSQFKYATDEDLRSIGLSRPEIRRLRKFYEKYFPHGPLSKIKRFLQTPKRDDGTSTAMSQASTVSPETASSSTSSAKAANSPSKAPNNKHIIPADSISVNKQLGTGEFGIVQQGVWTNGNERIQVAIKCLCRERMQSNPMEFLKEAAIMHSIEHENIVRLYGVVLATDSLMLVTELAHLRSLLECLKDAGLRVSFLTVPTLCEFAMQICNGMQYLEQKRLIHRDLAARNILVFSKNKVKISDFGLSRALGVGKDYYKTNFNVNLKLPIAWCAPECINYLRFTNASDVWAYGVCLWEMFSYGFQPWAALTGLQILEAIDAPNYQRLEQPDCCPREYYTLMMKCWQDDPAKRPKFSEIYDMLPDMKPEQLKAAGNCLEPKKDHLMYHQGDIITVLDRNTGSPFWKGVLNSGKTGYFNPSNTVAFLEGLPSSNRDSFCRVSERSSKRKLRTEMISKPQNDFKHTGHVGIDGASFGDIAFLGNSQSYNHVPRQIVTPYKPSEDIEQTPLLLPPTPTSPDSLATASGYFGAEAGHGTSLNPSFVPSTENTPKHFSQVAGQTSFEFPISHHQSSTNPFAYKLDEELFAMQNSNYGMDGRSSLLAEATGAAAEAPWSPTSTRNAAAGDDPHEYHEISDDEITADKLDFGPSLLDEINSMFGSMSASTSQQKSPDFDNVNIKNEFTEMTSKLVHKSSGGETHSNGGGGKFGLSSSKKKAAVSSMKPISVKDEKILNQAIEIANEFSARSMNDLVSDQQPAQSPKRKFSFRLPHLSHNGGGSGSGGGSGHDKHNSHGSSSAGGAGATQGGVNAQHGVGSPYAKKKNFTEELKSIPDLQRFRSLSEIKNVNSADIRIPLFDKETSDFCFEKSREILSRPLALDPLGLEVEGPDLYEESPAAAPLPPPSLPMSLTENIIDIENTLKALNLDFMHTYTELELDKTDSDETILNDQFSGLLSALEEDGGSGGGAGGGVSSGGGERSRSAPYKYNSNGPETTMFDFNAATNHLDKHLQYMHLQQTYNHSVYDSAPQDSHKLGEDKRASTPDTGFASRDTNISLSRRSSQKSSYSPQENFLNPKEFFSNVGKKEENIFSAEKFLAKYNARMLEQAQANTVFSPLTKGTGAVGTTAYSPPHQLKYENEQFRNASQQPAVNHRQRSMSFTDNAANAVSPVLSEPQQRLSRRSPRQQSVGSHHQRSTDPMMGGGSSAVSYRRSAYRPRSVRARTLRRLSYNPMSLASSSSSSDEGESDCPRNVARSECDIRSRASASSLYRRRRQGLTRKMAPAGHDQDEPEIPRISKNKLYGSNASIKSAPHYNYGGRSVSSMRGYPRHVYEQQFSYEDGNIYDFGGRGPGNNYVDTTKNQSRKGLGVMNNGGGGGGSSGGGGGSGGGYGIAPGLAPGVLGSGSGSSTGTSSGARGGGGMFHEFDVTRLTGKSPTSNFANSSPEERRNGSAIIGEEGREAYNSLIERKTSSPVASIFRHLDTNEFDMASAKTLPRRSLHARKENESLAGMSRLRRDSDGLGSAIGHGGEFEQLAVPLQNAPRPMTLPTRGLVNRHRKVAADMNESAVGKENENCNSQSPCESPSYMANTNYKFPEKEKAVEPPTTNDTNPIPLPPREGKKHIKTNAKRHVRKHPLIIPINGVQRTLNRLPSHEEDGIGVRPPAATVAAPTVQPCPLAGTTDTVASVRCHLKKQPAEPVTYENTWPIAAGGVTDGSDTSHTYQNLERVTNDATDSASLQFESILEADFGDKDNVLQSPDVTDGFYNFSIQKEQYNKSKVGLDAQQIGGLYVNEDELRNLDMEKNPKVKGAAKGALTIVGGAVEAATATTTTMTTANTSDNATAMNQVRIEEDEHREIAIPLAIKGKQPRVKGSDNELAANALFKKVRESVDSAMDGKTAKMSRSSSKSPSVAVASSGTAQETSKAASSPSQMPAPVPAKRAQTEGEYFASTAARLADSNSVSCEDLLEFSDKKPKGCERGVDSDEVRIMMKVLGKDSSPTRCLEVLEFIDWDVHKAIKIIKLQNILPAMELGLTASVEALQQHEWDLHSTALKLKGIQMMTLAR